MLLQKLWLPAVLVAFFPLWGWGVLSISRQMAQQEVNKARMLLGVTVAAINSGENNNGL